MPVAVNPTTGEAVRLDESGAWVPTKIARNPTTGESVALDGAEWRPVKMPEVQDSAKNLRTSAGTEPPLLNPPPEESWLDYGKGLAQQAGQGLTFNFGDELGAANLASQEWARQKLGLRDGDRSFSDLYAREKAGINAELDAFAGKHPVASTVANIAGAAVPGLATGGLGAGAGLLRATGINAAIGGASGAVSGAGAGETLPERAYNAAVGGTIGGVVGAVAPAVARGASSAWQGIRNAAGLQNPASTADDIVNRTLTREGLTPDEAVAAVDVRRAQAPGSQPTIADLGTQTQRLARTVETAPGSGSRKVTEFLTERQQGMGERVQAGIRANVSGGNQNATEQALRTARETAARPLYDQAFSHRPVHNDYVARMVEDPIVRQGIRRGLEVQRLEALAENRAFNPMDYAITGFDEAGDPILGKVPNMRLLDAAKRGLDDILEEARDPVTQRLRLDQRGRAVNAVRRSLVSTLDELNPDYAAARAAWSGPSQSMSAMQSGRAFMKGDIEDMEIRLGDLAQGDADYFLIGLSRELRQMVDSRGSDLADATRRLMKPEVQQRLAQVMGPERLGSLNDLLGVERQGGRTFATATGGSPTARIIADQNDAGDIAANAAADLVTQGARSAGTNVASRLVRRGKGINEGTADQLAGMLTAWTPEDLARLQARLNEARLREAAKAYRNRAIGRGALTGVAGAVPAVGERAN